MKVNFFKNDLKIVVFLSFVWFWDCRVFFCSIVIVFVYFLFWIILVFRFFINLYDVL